ncbi:MAG: SPOR domain-containing protein [Oleiphilaceae bacterium]|nr:SPOR domain-containing protein [Oleiphilaceae bacterium]
MSESVDGLKQRLVGAFVILSLAVIFLPMLFDKPHREGAEAVELVPEKPQMQTVVISKPNPNVKKNAPASELNPDSELPKLVPAAEPIKPTTQTDEKTVNSLSEKAPVPVAVSTPKGKEPSSSVVSKPKVYKNVWMVQLGTFSNKENAFKLRDRLREAGIDGHTKSLKSGSAIRVFAGPFVTKKEAIRIKRKLDSQFKVNSLVVFFEA